MRTPLTSEQHSDLVSSHPDWTIEENEMRRTFEFSDFREAMAFVTSVALAAEKLDHHPDIDIRWNKVKLGLSTHSAGTLTGLDAELARLADTAV